MKGQTPKFYVVVAIVVIDPNWEIAKGEGFWSACGLYVVYYI